MCAFHEIKNVLSTMKHILKSLTYIAKLKLIVEKCLTYVFNPLTYVLVFVAKIQDASFPPTRNIPKEHTITNSMHTILLKIKYNYREVGSAKQSGFVFKLIFNFFIL